MANQRKSAKDYQWTNLYDMCIPIADKYQSGNKSAEKVKGINTFS